MTNLLKRCWQRRWVRGLAWTVVTLVTIIALLCAWINWGGARQWSRTQAMLKAEGESVDFRATMSDPVPDVENFCAIPPLKDLALVIDDDSEKGAPGERRKRLDTLRLPAKSKGGTHPKTASAAFGSRCDLNAWADWLRKDESPSLPADTGNAARDVLAALSTHDAIVRELAAGLKRPRAQWTPSWKTRELPSSLFTIALPHYSPVRQAGEMLALRSIAAARAGDPAKAHEAALIAARLNQACLEEPFLIGLLIAAAGTSHLVNAVWELCDAQAGNAEEFRRLESSLAAMNYQHAALRAWRSEMAAAVDTLQFIKDARDGRTGVFQLINNDGATAGSAVGNLLTRAIPKGFFDSNTAVLADREFVHLIKPLRDQGWRAVLSSADGFDDEMQAIKSTIWMHPSFLISVTIAPATKGMLHRSAYAQALVNQAVAACALERFRIERGSYPDTLDAVRLADGKPLPLDIIDDKAMSYRKTADGRYTLWSVGFDGKDDGGKRVLDEKKPENTRFHDEKYLGDWVWDFPAK